MTIEDATRATRKWRCDYFDHTLYADDSRSISVSRNHDLQAACDRMNLLAVLESDAIRNPSERMLRASDRFAHTDETENIDWKGIARIQWRTMIDALIAEVREQGNG